MIYIYKLIMFKTSTTALQTPCLKEGLKNVEAPVKGTVKFNAKISGYPAPEALWFVNNFFKYLTN